MDNNTVTDTTRVTKIHLAGIFMLCSLRHQDTHQIGDDRETED